VATMGEKWIKGVFREHNCYLTEDNAGGLIVSKRRI
jgi:hypothetical protein